jgi:hypothetical protein
MMNKIIIMIVLTAFALTACGTASPAASISASEKSSSDEAMLIVGIFKLENTDQAVTVKQASELLPLWEVIKSMAASDTSAQEEVDAAIGQIRENLTSTQLQKITAMNLTEQDVSVFEQTLSAGTMIKSTSQSATSSKSSAGLAGPPDGGPGGDALGGVVMGMSQVQGSTASASTVQAFNRTSIRVSSTMLEAVIKLMQERANM